MKGRGALTRLCILEPLPGRAAIWLVYPPLEVGEAGAEKPLPAAAVSRVFERYGLPFEPEGAAPTERLRVEAGWLARLSHRTWYDVLPRDYLVYEPDEGAPRYQLCTHVAAALLHLAARYHA